MYSRTNIRIALSALIIALGISLSAVIPASAIMLVSRSQEIEIGKQVEAQMIKQYGGLSNDSALTSRVQKIGKSVAAFSPRKDVTYTYKVVNSEIINAFAAPGGPIVVTQGLARKMTDDELAFVLGHETGHVAAQHGRKAMNRAMVAQGVASIFFSGSGDVVRLGVNMMYTLYDRGYSRDQEYEADGYGVRLMKQAGYNTEAAVSALAKLGMQKSKGVNKYMATHPDVPDRINRIAKMAGISDQRKQQIIQQVQAKETKNK